MDSASQDSPGVLNGSDPHTLLLHEVRLEPEEMASLATTGKENACMHEDSMQLVGLLEDFGNRSSVLHQEKGSKEYFDSLFLPAWKAFPRKNVGYAVCATILGSLLTHMEAFLLTGGAVEGTDHLPVILLLVGLIMEIHDNAILSGFLGEINTWYRDPPAFAFDSLHWWDTIRKYFATDGFYSNTEGFALFSIFDKNWEELRHELGTIRSILDAFYAAVNELDKQGSLTLGFPETVSVVETLLSAWEHFAKTMGFDSSFHFLLNVLRQWPKLLSSGMSQNCYIAVFLSPDLDKSILKERWCPTDRAKSQMRLQSVVMSVWRHLNQTADGAAPQGDYMDTIRSAEQSIHCEILLYEECCGKFPEPRAVLALPFWKYSFVVGSSALSCSIIPSPTVVILSILFFFFPGVPIQGTYREEYFETLVIAGITHPCLFLPPRGSLNTSQASRRQFQSKMTYFPHPALEEPIPDENKPLIDFINHCLRCRFQSKITRS
ncbi:hypothetical protein SISNIDRAFT_471063 [Sistotremastrum niveocremeum HHB9708]|uniref:Uncharacterized protein n=1 Tax=Sistotremastrum niveocremeum HHB9708 TaxID=1314777 RepID=A0A164N3C8_9AGAM|nr:hypothetical protein SISNIDRAFT_471063 [Sistotremastrum niveocremeum HHB9708]